MRITNLEQLTDLAESDPEIHQVLADMNIGRRGVVMCLADTHGINVSEKLVRTYREKREHNFKEFMSIVGLTTERDRLFREAVNAKPKIINRSAVLEVQKVKPKTIVIMPDVQAPLHDVKLVNKFIKFIKDFQPTEIAQVGDFTDSTEISRWVRGKKPEYAGDLKAGFTASKGILRDIREVFDGRFRIVRSNHDDRLELYVEGCAPGLATFLDDELSIERLAGFNEYGVEFIRDEVVELAPNWVMGHGDEGALSPVAGRTAFGLAKNKFGVSVVCGHTHRAGLTSETYGFNGKIHHTLTGLEVGHFMDITKADYLKKKGVAANWQQAFGILEIYGDRVYPRLIPVQDGYFSVDGVLY